MRHRRRPETENGFTLIELLVVVIIIGVLAAIAIPTFLKQRENGHRAQLVTDLRTAAVHAESYAAANEDTYVGLALTDVNADKNVDVTLAVDPADQTVTAFCVSGTHARLPGVSLHFQKAERVPLAGVCP